jgi:hypothetical protein
MAVLGALVMAAAGPADAQSRRLDRQIELFERVVDDMLVESPNWLVQSSEETRGRYRAGEGARFRFDATLVYRGWGKHWRGKWWKNIFVDGDEDVIVIDRNDWDDMSDKEIKELRDDARKSTDKHRERTLRRQQRLYDRGKVELVETLSDFGDVLTALPDNESIELVAELGDSDYFDEKDLRELRVSAKMSDIRALAEGKIDEKKFVERVKVEES